MRDSDRHVAIAEMLNRMPFASVRDLQERLDVSAATIRRDIDRLHEMGKVRKVHGGIASVEGAHLAARPYDENRDLAVEAKRAIAAQAETLVRDGDSLIINAGSTCFQFGSRLANRNVRIFTNSMPLAAYLGEHGSCHLAIGGGELYREPSIIHDLSASEPNIYASKFFLGAQGVGAEGLLESHPLLKVVVENFSRRADQVILLADSRKFSIRPRHAVLPLQRVSTIVTDDGLNDTDARMLEDAGVSIVIANSSVSKEGA